MREADVREVGASGHTPKQALRLGLMASTWALTAKVDGRPEAMLGLVPVSALTGEGCPWMLGTPEVYRHGRALLRHGPAIVERMLDSTPHRLANKVGAFNEPAIRLLRRLGFSIGKEVILTAGVEFVAFSMER